VGGAPPPKAAEWFLDNYYLIRRAVRQVEEELPRGFVARLPRLTSGSSKGKTRIESLSGVLVAGSALVLDLAGVRVFVDAYQEVTPLTIAELWAFPTILRATVLRHLRAFIDTIRVPDREDDRSNLLVPRAVLSATTTEGAELDSSAGVERCIRALRILDVIDWKLFFEATSRAESILRHDPAGVYGRMDFETCDSYRKVVEDVAWATGRPEAEVAQLVVNLANGAASDERGAHVGYYLVARGRAALEARLGYRPTGLERVRRAATGWPTVSYLLPLALLTGILLLALTSSLVGVRGHPSVCSIIVAVTVAVIPVSAVSVAVLNFVFAHLLHPRTLPKLNFEKGLPGNTRTLVVMPTLLGRSADVVAMLRRLELHYLANPDPNLEFALLTDDVDTQEPVARTASPSLLEDVSQGVTALNGKHGSGGRGPFHVLHRTARWNPAEERFMGWERKRGKLEELNRLLRGDQTTTYSCHVGEPEGLLGIRFVITVDSDTELPIGSAQRLVGLLSHPLNTAVFDPTTGRVIAGYTIAQPRIETSPSSARETPFSRMFAGRIGFDIYTHACSELYQDLFGSGIYVGKGIYEIDPFMRSLEGRAPENMLVSHDLFEGIHGRTALVTDVVLFESYPSTYAAYALRMHRWVRGDWQLLPWLRSRVPSESGGKVSNRLVHIDRWKIVDNVRRSLTSPLLFALFILGWAWPFGKPLLCMLATLAILLAPMVSSLAGRPGHRLAPFGRCVLAIVLLPYEASVIVDAVLRVLVRKNVTGKHLLQWTSDAHAAFGVAARSSRAMYWRTMASSPLLALAVLGFLAWLRPSSLAVAAPVLLVWFVSPEVARAVSQWSPRHVENVTETERRTLRLLARRTWRFFGAFVGPNDQWLPVDNYQSAPHEKTAHRTSPTNMGLGLIATLSAYDFGYVCVSELALSLRRAFDSVMRMEHYQGHLLNWYDTRSLKPLLPRYVSTVDSGNFAGCLVALAQGCRELAMAPVVRAEAWDGLLDSIDLLDEVVTPDSTRSLVGLRAVIARLRDATTRTRGRLQDAHGTLRLLSAEIAGDLERELLAFLDAGAHRHEADMLHELRTSMDMLRHQVRQMQRELDALLPWLALSDEAAGHGLDLPRQLRLDEIPVAAHALDLALEANVRERRARGEMSPALEASSAQLFVAFRAAARDATALRTELMALAERAREEVRGMDFNLLYDAERQLFRIGYNVTSDQVDAHHYDLLESEARLASYLAIVKRDVPESHWYTLGRPMTRANGAPMLLSWGGTMFEYLMPELLMRSQAGTLLARTSALAVDVQIASAKRNGEPWGVSESAYAHLDSDQNYQYRSFGVPGLGLKRGLDDDRVLTPYASVLAVSIRPKAVVSNVIALQGLGMVGTYGLFEALDMTPERALQHPPHGKPFAIVRSYMAHHQGMLLVALGNYLNRRSMVDRFHSDAWVESGEFLLNEYAPDAAPTEAVNRDGGKGTTPDTAVALPYAPAPWSLGAPTRPQAFVLSNGALTSLITGSGGGGLRWRGLDLTRYEPDATHDSDGLWFYLRDEETRHVWRATSREGRTTYAMHDAEFQLRDQGISVHLDVTVAASDDVEVRKITLHNETDRPRSLTLTSAGRPVLFDAKQAPTHPAFSSMFVETEYVAELDALLFARRPQSPEEEPAVMVHGLVREGAGVTFAGFESDRGAFLGRGAGRQVPAPLLMETEGLHGRVGAVLDPVMSLMVRIELAPNSSVALAFVTAVGRSRHVALALTRKYSSMHAVRWVFRDAEQGSRRRLQRTKVEPSLVPTIQRFFSAVLFDDPTLRVSAARRAADPPCQRRLWGLGISGDEPIVLVRVADPGSPLLRETLATQRFLRDCGVPLDVVLIDEHASEYAAAGSETLGAVLELEGVGEWLGRHGGVFVLATDKLSVTELRHLEACARVLLDTRDGSLASRLAPGAEGSPSLPRFEPTRVEETAPSVRARPKLLFDNGIGGFTEDGREYVLDVGPGQQTPAPWCNVLANPAFGCLVSESGLGTTWSLNSGENRLTPWRNDPVLDTPSEVVYLRDEETAEVWSPTPLPAGLKAQTRVRHGAGYTTYESESHGLVQEMTVFVPRDAGLKIVRLRMQNTLPRSRRLTATYYAEWVLGSRRKRQAPYIVSDLDRDRACLLATCDWSAEFAGRVAFLASKEVAHGYTADRTEFLGRDGDYGQPEALKRWGLSGRVDLGADPCAALQVHLEVAAGGALETHFILGQAATGIEALALVERFRDASVVEAAWKDLSAYWDEILGAVRVKTPEPSMDLMLNRWLLYQTLSSRVFGRTGFYQSSGAFGYRDQLQDVLALLHAAPSIARGHILEAAKHQFLEGDVLHWWHPPSGRGVRTRCSDDMAWLPYVTSEYVEATGDAGILDECVPFLEGAPLEPDEDNRYARYDASPSSAPLLEHCRRALERAMTVGRHGLPLMGDGDWNDGMSRVGAKGIGESVWLAWFLCATMDRFAALTATGDSAGAARWRARAESLRATTRDVAWDGAWYLRAFHDDGSLVGSATSRECQIDSIAQSWAVLSEAPGEAYDARSRAAVRVADDRLVREDDRLVLLFSPPFDTTRHDPGYIRAYPPGVRENGGQYTHAATWLGFAHAALGDGEAAERLFRLLNPVLQARTREDAACFRVEPYALAGDVYSCSPWIGRGGWTWYTGAAAWMWRLGVHEILGLRREDGRLRIDPCIPPHWDGFEAWVRQGERTLHIVVHNPDRVARGVAAVMVDGVSSDSARIDVDGEAGPTLEVRVQLGPSRSARAGAAA
jgi:cyclic beta-1,2-glucan synthetase